MKFDTTVKELQKEKADLEAKLKQVNTALAALAKLGEKQTAAPERPSALATSAVQPQPATTAKSGVSPTQPSTKPFGS
jgi:hypothetical protein